jgi:hypothetical protein
MAFSPHPIKRIRRGTRAQIMIEGQVSMFDDKDDKEKTKEQSLPQTRLFQYRFVENHVSTDLLTTEELFNKEFFTSCLATTFSASPSFLHKYLGSFRKVCIVIGIPEPAHQKGIAEMSETEACVSAAIDPLTLSAASRLETEKRIKSFDLFNAEEKGRFIKHEWAVWYAVDQSIHSKIILLKGEEHSRVIVGSANLSYQAFNERIPQFENVVIFDDMPEIFNAHEQWIRDSIIPVCSPYWPESTLKGIKRDKQRIPKVKITDDADDADVKVGITGEKEEADIVAWLPMKPNDVIKSVEESISDALSESNRHATEGLLPEEAQEAKLSSDKQLTKRASDAARKDLETSYELVSKSVVPAKGKVHARGKDKVKSVVREKIRIEVSRSEKITDTAPSQPLLLDNPTSRVFTEDFFKTGLYVQGSAGSELSPYGQLLTPEEIRAELQLIDRFVETYRDYSASGATDEYLQRIIEAIMFGFTSPFLWEIRKKIVEKTSKSSGTQVPNFMLIGAAGHSGKTTLLRAIGKMMTVDKSEPLLFSRIKELVSTRNTATQWSKTIEFVKELMSLNNETVYPVLLDEVPKEIFRNIKYCDSLIKDYTNEHLEGQKTAACIMVANLDDMHMPNQIMRRLDYLQFDNIILESEKTRAVTSDFERQFSPRLFEDFVCRMTKLLYDDQTDWTHSCVDKDGIKSQIDFLYNSRMIFKNYYEIAGLEIPNWFPETLVNDEKRIAQQMAKDCFRGQGNCFELRRFGDEDVLIAHLQELFGDITYNKKPAKWVQFAESVPLDVLYHEPNQGPSRSGNVLFLKADRFYEWAKIPEEERWYTEEEAAKNKKSFWKKLFSRNEVSE